MRRRRRQPWTLLRVSIGLQQLGAHLAGTALSASFGAFAVWRTREPLPTLVELATHGAYLIALRHAVERRRRPPVGAALARLDFELGSLAAVGVAECVWWAQSGPRGAYWGIAHVAFAVFCAFAGPLAAVATWLAFSVLVAALHAERLALATYLPLLALVGLSGLATALCLRGLLQQTERRCRANVEQELERLRDAARSYRLSTVAANADPPLPPRAADEGPELEAGEQALLRSSVDEIAAALGSALSLCRLGLGCRTVVVLWLDPARDLLYLRGASGEQRSLLAGPFSSKEGIFAAALESGRRVELVGTSAARPLPYDTAAVRKGHVVALPIVDEGGAAGVLALDRGPARALEPAELEILDETSRLVRRAIDNERVLQKLDRAKVEQGKLYRAVERLNEARTEAQVIEAGVSQAREFTAFQFAAVTLLRKGGEHEICAVSGEGAEELVGRTFRDATGLVGMVVDNRHPLPYRGQCEAGVQVLFTKDLPAPRLPSILVLPLLVHRDVLGTLVLGSNEPGGFGADVRLILQVLARHISVSLANARMVKRLEELATTDGLTGLLNKRALTEMAKQKLRSAQRFNKPLSVLVCDLDHFKRVNDSHGHDVGDRVITGFAEVLLRTKRETDTVGRFGGEEFVVVCEQTDPEGAELLARRVRQELAATTFVTKDGPLRVTCSVGVATYPQGGSDWDELFKSTDEALYASKRAGR
ncbi:MAG TPA: sensor domain-containing diguanylate cyclase, partial [Polyangiaceae bacterium]|nr:sensor domain-containing diguanylate cyclase [Polyangiaceae bacterium]